MDINEQSLNIMCRTCMNILAEASSYYGKIKRQQWQSISDRIEECGALRIAELLSAVVPQVQIRLSDELPKKICRKCVQQLLSVYRFQQMCAQSEERMRKLFSKRRTDLKMSTIEAAMEQELETKDTDSFPLKNFLNSTLQNLQHPSIQEPLLEAIEHVIESEAAQSSGAEHLENIDQLLEACKDAQGNFNEFIKNEPIDVDDPSIEYNDDDPMQSATCATKSEMLTAVAEEKHINTASPQSLVTDSEEQQIKVNTSHYNCHICNTSFKVPESLEKHLESHKTNAEQAQADLRRSRRLPKMKSLQNHSVVHEKKVNIKKHSTKQAKTSRKKYPCDLCNKSFKDSFTLGQHVRAHTGERPYLCPECGKSFSTEGNVKAHRLRHCEDKPYECPYCPLRFRYKHHITQHKQMHEGVKRKACDICGKCVRDLNTHRLLHSEEKPHKCDFCEKRSLKRHRHNISRRKKTRDRPLCDTCGQSFRKQWDLNRHKLIHAEVKPLKCEVCGQRFNRHEHLRAHMRSHTGEKPFKCKYCERAFARHSVMVVHSSIHLGETIFKCKLCPLHFPSAAKLRLHFITHKHENSETREHNMKALKEVGAKRKFKLAKTQTQGSSAEESE